MNPIARKPNRPVAALDWCKAKGVTPASENRLEVRNGNEESEIMLLGSVGKSWWDDSGITESEFRNALDQIPKGKPITVKINSEGGSVQEGLGIYNAIKDRASDITCKVTGYALSIASVFPLAASKVVSPKSAIWMIHEAWSNSSGNKRDKLKDAEMLGVHDGTLEDIYCECTGKSRAEIQAAMEAETWIKGSDAVAWGLADETDVEDDDSNDTLAAGNRDTRPKNANPLGSAAAAQVVATPTTAPVTPAAALSPASLTQPGTTNTNQHQHMPETTTPAAAQPAATNGDTLAQVQAQLATERKARITDRITRIAENKIKNENLNWWIDLAMKDEAGAVAQIEAMPSAHVGAEPLGGGGVSIVGAPVLAGWGEKPTEQVENIFKQHSTPKARFAAVRDNYSAIMAAAARRDGCKVGVLAANTYSATLTTNFLILGATTKLSPKFAAIKAFSRDVSVDPYKPLASGVMKFTSSVQDGSDVLVNATNFNQSNNEVDAVTITVSQYTAPGSIANGDLNNGLRMEDIAHAKLMSLGSKIVQTAVANITIANYTTTPITAALNPQSFGFAETRSAYAAIKKAVIRNLILDGEYAAGLLNQPAYFQKSIEQENGPGHWENVFGWDNVFENTEWSTAGANVHGFACDPQALGVIAGLPLINQAGIPGGILSVSTGVIPGADLPIAAYVWFDLPSRTYYISYDSMFGANVLDSTAGVIIKSA